MKILKALVAGLFVLACVPVHAVLVVFQNESNVVLGGANAGCLADVKSNYAKDWPDIGRQVVVKVRERCSDKAVPYSVAKAQVDAAEAVGLAIPDADKADLERRK